MYGITLKDDGNFGFRDDKDIYEEIKREGKPSVGRDVLKRAYEAYLRNKEEIEFHLDEIMTAKEFSDFKSMKFQDLKLFENIKYLNYLGRVCEAGESGKHVLMRAYRN